MAGAWSNVHVRFPFENKAGDQESDHGLVSGGMFLCESGVFVLWDAAGRLYAYDNSHLDVVCIVQSHSKLPIVDACQSNTLLFTLQQCGTVNSYFTSPSQLLTENKSLDAGTVAQAVGEAMGMCTCNGRFLAIHGKRTRSVLVVQTDTLVALQVLHGQADFVVACLASSGNLLVTSNLTGLLNVWTCSNKAFSLEYTMCALGFSLPFSSSPSITAVTVRKLVQANPTSLVVLTSLGECVLARDFDKVNELVVDVVLAHRVMDIDFVHECLYVLREDGAVLILDHYMTERTLVQASNDRVLIDQLNLVPGSCEGDLLICMGGNVVQLYNSRGEVVATQTQQPVRNTARPLAMLVAPNRKCRTRYHTVICQQTSPGVLEASCFSHTIPIADCLVNDNCNAYTCLEYVEHQNGFFCLAGKGNGQLDVYNLCLPLLTRNHNGSDGEIKLELHKSLPSLHFGAIQAIFVCGDDGNGSTRPSLCCTVDKNHHQVVVLSCKDFTVLHRFAGHQSPVCNVRWNWPFLYVQVANGKTFVWNLVNGMLERLLQHPPALVESAYNYAGVRELDLGEMAKEMNGIESNMLGQVCGGVLSLLHVWGFNSEVDLIAQSVFGFAEPSGLDAWFVQHNKFSSMQVLARRGDVFYAMLPEFATKHMLQVCCMYYLLSQYEPNFHPLFTFYCVDLPPRTSTNTGSKELSLDCLVQHLTKPCSTITATQQQAVVIRLLVCQQLDRLGPKRRPFLFETWSSKLLAMHRPKSGSGNDHHHHHHTRKELTTMQPIPTVVVATASAASANGQQQADNELMGLLRGNDTYKHVVLLLTIGCVTHMEEVSPVAARLVTEALVESICAHSDGGGDGGISPALASDLLSLGFVLFRPHISHMSRLIRSLLHLLGGEGDQNVGENDSVQHLLKRIGLVHPVLSIRTIGNELLDVNQTLQFRVAVMGLLVYFSRDEDAAANIMLKYMVMVVEILMKTLDPHDAGFRRQCFATSSALLQQLVKRFPMCAFHQPSQRFALGTLESAIIVYDVRTATKLKVLDGTQGSCTALSFDPTGEKLASYSATEHAVRIWTTNGGLLDSFLVRGTLLAKHGLAKLDCKATLQQILRTCRLSWATAHEVKLRREDSKVVALRV